VRAFLDGDATRALEDGIRAVEQASCAEVVIAVRRRSAAHLHANVLAGAIGLLAALAYMLYGSHTFGLASFLVDPIIAAVLVGAAVELFPAFTRLVTPRSVRHAAVLRGARATFVERGVHLTRGRTGILVYVSLVEAQAEVVVDGGVATAWPDESRARLAAAVTAAIPGGGMAVGKAIAAVAPALGQALPRAADDVNELPDAVDIRPKRRWRS
jgi:putative membrane protein